MRRLPILLIFFFTLFLNTSIAALAQETNLLKDLPLEVTKKIILDNGLIVILKEAPSSGLVSIDVKVRAGSASEADLSGSGISHLVEHMIFKGTAKRRPGQIEKEIRALGGLITGSTTYDYTSFAITIPKEHLFYALEALIDSLFNANMNPAELEKEQKVILKEIRLNRDDPIRYISQLLWSSVFKTHPYQHPVIGYESLFCKLTREDLLRHYRKLYVPNNMVLVLVGDIESDNTIKEIKNYFQHIERALFEEKPLAQERLQTSKRILEVERELEMSYLALGYRSVSAQDPDMPALDLLSFMLGQGESSRLNSIVYRKKNLVYSVGSWNYTPNDPGIFIISGVTQPKKLKSACAAIKEEIKNIKEGGVDDYELQRAKAMITANYIYSLATLIEQAEDLATNEISTGDFNFTKRYLEKIDSVTKDDIIRVARSYLNDDQLSLITLSPPKQSHPSQREEKKSQKNIQKITLPNGLRCLLMEDHNLPAVSLVAVCLGGLTLETESSCGLSNLTGLMMLKGTISRSEEEISKLVESMGGNLNFFSGNNSLGIKFDFLSKDREKGLELFEDIILNPAFPKDILQREKETIMASIKAVDDDIFEAGMKTFRETLFKIHPYRFQTMGTIDSVKNLTKTKLEEFYKRYFIPNNMVLAIFGDIDLDMIQKRVNEKFSQLKKGPSPQFTSPQEPRQLKIRQDLKIVQKEQSLIIQGFKGASLKDKDRHTLQLISVALSGITGRLSSRLREDMGLAYAVGSFSVPAIDPGYFILYTATTSDNIGLVKKEFLNQIKLLNKKGLTDEEIDSAKKELIGNQLIALETNLSLAHHTALDELYGLEYDYYLKYNKIINSITKRDIIEVSRRYLNPRAFTLVVIEGRRGG